MKLSGFLKGVEIKKYFPEESNSNYFELVVLCTFIHALILCSFCIPIFTEAAKTYFTSMSGSQRLKSSGKYDSKCIQQRRRNRAIRVRVTIMVWLKVFN